MKVAIIDDEADIREIIRDLLEMEGYEVIEADNGATGLQLIRNHSPDLIICDIRMPEMTGDELFDELRSQRSSDLGMIPFIFLSGNANEQEQIKRLKKGAENCFEKPIDLSLLAAHVNSHLSSVTRISEFIKRKLDAIARSFPKIIEHDFSSQRSLVTNAAGYVDVIVSAMEGFDAADTNPLVPRSKITNATAGECSRKDSRPPSATELVDSRLNYIRYCSSKLERRRELVRSANGEDLSWTLIFMVAQAELEDQKITVSDLYVSIPSAKSTINARINSLIEDDVFKKISDLTDGRRQLLLLTGRFRVALMGHVDGSIKLIGQIIKH